MLGSLGLQLIALQVVDLLTTWRGLSTAQAVELNPAGRALLSVGFLPLVLVKAAGTAVALIYAGWMHRSSNPAVALVGLWAWWAIMVAVTVWNGLILMGFFQ